MTFLEWLDDKHEPLSWQRAAAPCLESGEPFYKVGPLHGKTWLLDRYAEFRAEVTQ